ncbi:MAG: hypothetical protein WD489_08235 [Rhodovibrionaceae bacterium]
MAEKKIEVGQKFIDANPPSYEWRVLEIRGENVLLQRVDKERVSRIPPAEVLLDPLYYKKIRV